MGKTSTISGQPCPTCGKKTLTLAESELEVPFFGKLFVFSMTCSNCKYRKSDVEAAEKKKPCKYSIDVKGKEDLNIRVVKSSEATVKISHVGSIEPGTASEGYVTNIEGIIQRMKQQIETLRNSEEDNDKKKKCKKLIKKLQKVLWGQEKLKITIEDPTGNSAIISEKVLKK